MAYETVFNKTGTPAPQTETVTQTLKMPSAKDLGVSGARAQQISQGAASGQQMQNMSSSEQKAYAAYQNYYASETTRKAREGIRLDSPNDWKNSVYQDALKSMNSSDGAYYNSEHIMDRQQEGSQDYMSAMEKYLQQSKEGYLGTQEAMLGKARDEQVAELQKALEDAVSEGKISVREAEAAFEENKGVIEQETYQDAERTKLAAGERGISNSAQMLGMQAGDNARKNTMINKNMTERDSRVMNIKDRVAAIKNKSAIDTSMANANFNYGLAGAQGQADMQFGQQMADMRSQEHNTTRQQGFALDQQGMAQGQQEKMAEMAQNFTLEQFAVQQGYNLENMSTQQKNQLEQMRQGFIYNESLQNDQQQWQGYQNYYDRSHQKDMQEGQQTWQGDQNYYDRDHQKDMQETQQDWQTGENSSDRTHQEGLQTGQQKWQSEENSADRKQRASEFASTLKAQREAANNTVDEYALALEREMAKYTEGTPEYKLKGYQMSEAQAMMDADFKKESEMQMIAEATAKGGIPVDPGPKPKLESFMSMFEKTRLSLTVFGFGDFKDLRSKYEQKYKSELDLWEQNNEYHKMYQKTYGD